ncbi:MAG: hypothetical protein HKO59_14515 [Phycisphaerales bacterium]|nr:hypothetical protein [Phycisphaerales bacterium]NNM27174.1 hypothetical protein [Phycisphaerales bacterium]
MIASRPRQPDPDPAPTLEEAKRRLRDVGTSSDTATGIDALPFVNPLRHPLAVAAGAVALGVGLTAAARTRSGRSVLRLAGRSLLTAGRLFIVPAIAKSVAKGAAKGAVEAEPAPPRLVR